METIAVTFNMYFRWGMWGFSSWSSSPQHWPLLTCSPLLRLSVRIYFLLQCKGKLPRKNILSLSTAKVTILATVSLLSVKINLPFPLPNWAMSKKGSFFWEIFPNSKLCWMFNLIFGQCKLLPAIQFASSPGKGGVRAFISMTPAQVALDLIPFKRIGYFTICSHTEVCWAS